MTASGKLQKLPSVKRLPAYLYELRRLRELGRETVSTSIVAKRLGVEPIVVRKDFEMTGAVGEPRIGYRLAYLIGCIENYLGWHNTSEAFLVGSGSLGTALLGYRGFADYGLNILAAFDIDPAKVGQTIHEKPVIHLSKLPSLIRRMNVKLAILCVPATQAQETSDFLIESGIRAIWNFSNSPISVPENTVIQQSGLIGDLAVLSVRIAEKFGEER